LSLCTKAGAALALVDGTDERLRAQAGALGPHVRWVGAEADARQSTFLRALPLPGAHNARNALIAREILLGLGIGEANDDDAMAAAASAFDGLPSRCQSLGRVGGVEFVDDSLSTNVLPAQAALAAYADRPVALLVGGHDRGIDYAPLGETLAQRTQPTLVVTLPDNGPRIGAAVRAVSGAAEVIDAPDLAHAVATAFAWAETGAVVLLSPAAPSFGQFSDYRDRARSFAEAASRCGALG
jgi:UDP-N-acetylmuramoylalanine--D-glutamate ligase